MHSISTDEKNNARKSSAGKIQGELKLSLEYRKDALLVMVHHAKDLAMPDGSKEAPNSYVKVIKLPENLSEYFLQCPKDFCKMYTLISERKRKIRQNTFRPFYCAQSAFSWILFIVLHKANENFYLS